MKKSERIKLITDILEKLYPNPKIPLNSVNPFTFLVAVMLSAQSTDKKVNQITPELFRIADTPEKMTKLSIDEIQKIIREIGLAPTKAKNIRKMSEQLIERHQGEVPCSFKDLEALAGVGHKTASVIMSQCFNQPAFPVDTHIHRLAKRWKLSNGKNVTQSEKDLKRLFLKEKWNDLHLQMIYFGREHCPALRHKEEICPICSCL